MEEPSQNVHHLSLNLQAVPDSVAQKHDCDGFNTAVQSDVKDTTTCTPVPVAISVSCAKRINVEGYEDCLSSLQTNNDDKTSDNSNNNNANDEIDDNANDEIDDSANDDKITHDEIINKFYVDKTTDVISEVKKRGRGRPKGSLNKLKINVNDPINDSWKQNATMELEIDVDYCDVNDYDFIETSKDTTAVDENLGNGDNMELKRLNDQSNSIFKKRRGRPKGSLNKRKINHSVDGLLCLDEISGAKVVREVVGNELMVANVDEDLENGDNLELRLSNDESNHTLKKRRGRPKGSLNKRKINDSVDGSLHFDKTLAVEAVQEVGRSDEFVPPFVNVNLENCEKLETKGLVDQSNCNMKKRRGRPKGSLNKRKIVLKMKGPFDLLNKKRRGRPKGSVNKLKRNILVDRIDKTCGVVSGNDSNELVLENDNRLEIKGLFDQWNNIFKKRKGRPKGSLNKLKRNSLFINSLNLDKGERIEAVQDDTGNEHMLSNVDLDNQDSRPVERSTIVKKRRGRPKGSLNKSKRNSLLINSLNVDTREGIEVVCDNDDKECMIMNVDVYDDDIRERNSFIDNSLNVDNSDNLEIKGSVVQFDSVVKKRRGRPKGSLNKPKLNGSIESSLNLDKGERIEVVRDSEDNDCMIMNVDVYDDDDDIHERKRNSFTGSPLHFGDSDNLEIKGLVDRLEGVVKKRRGRPKGSLNKPKRKDLDDSLLNLDTVEGSEVIGDSTGSECVVENVDLGLDNQDSLQSKRSPFDIGDVKKRKGRPKGSLNKPKQNNLLESSEMGVVRYNDDCEQVKESVVVLDDVKKPTGQLKGSVNKPKINNLVESSLDVGKGEVIGDGDGSEYMVVSADTSNKHVNLQMIDNSNGVVAKKRGRPKGSLNKIKRKDLGSSFFNLEKEARMELLRNNDGSDCIAGSFDKLNGGLSVKKRGKGRPKGSLNKPKVNDVADSSLLSDKLASGYCVEDNDNDIEVLKDGCDESGINFLEIVHRLYGIDGNVDEGVNEDCN